MKTQEQINLIRRKCIEANPDNLQRPVQVQTFAKAPEFITYADMATVNLSAPLPSTGVSNVGNVTTTNETVSSTLTFSNVTPSGTVIYPFYADGSSFPPHRPSDRK